MKVVKAKFRKVTKSDGPRRALAYSWPRHPLRQCGSASKAVSQSECLTVCKLGPPGSEKEMETDQKKEMDAHLRLAWLSVKKCQSI